MSRIEHGRVMSDLTGRVVVVTGADGGIGRAVAACAQDHGATVVGVDHASGFDVTSEQDWVALMDSIDGPVHRLVNCAGITWRSRLAHVRSDDMARIYSVNVIGTLLAVQAVGARMPSGSSIVNVGSLAALTAHYPVAYTAAKWAVRGLTKAAALEWGSRGVRVNIVHPGFIDTAMTRSAPGVFREASIAETPLGRAGEPEEVARVAVFLLGDESSFVTGAEIPVDGGASSHGGVKSIADALRVDNRKEAT